MNKKLLLIIGMVLLNSCAQSTSFVGPTYTLAKSGSIMQTGTSVATSYGIKQTFNQVDKNLMITSISNGDIRECQTFHTSSLNEIFFETLDEIDCYRAPFSVFK